MAVGKSGQALSNIDATFFEDPLGLLELVVFLFPLALNRNKSTDCFLLLQAKQKWEQHPAEKMQRVIPYFDVIDVQDEDLDGGAESRFVFDGAERFGRRTDSGGGAVDGVQLVGDFDEDLVPSAAAPTDVAVRARLAAGHLLLQRLHARCPCVADDNNTRHNKRSKRVDHHFHQRSFLYEHFLLQPGP